MIIINKEDFLEYERVRQSGLTNMFNIAVVCEMSGLTREKVFKIMREYAQLKERFLR